MFIELLDSKGDIVLVNLSLARTILPFEDENEKMNLLKTGVLIKWENGSEEIFTGCSFYEISSLLDSHSIASAKSRFKRLGT